MMSFSNNESHEKKYSKHFETVTNNEIVSQNFRHTYMYVHMHTHTHSPIHINTYKFTI